MKPGLTFGPARRQAFQERKSVILWASVVFGFDRMHDWKFRPGQLIYESMFGGGQKSYDPSGMLFRPLLFSARRDIREASAGIGLGLQRNGRMTK
jgi:hypothetical protein